MAELDRLRDEFAIAALPVLLQDALDKDEESDDGEQRMNAVAKAAYKVADSMLKARGENPNG